MNGFHQFVLRIPYQLWERLVKHYGKGNITAFIIRAITEILEREQTLS